MVMPNRFPHGYALLMGVGACAYPAWSLPVTVKDVQALRAVLLDARRCAYVADDQHVRLLHDASATRAALLDGLAWLAGRAAADPDATVIVYYSGHGWVDCHSGRYYLIPHDAQPHHLTNTALPAELFHAALQQIQAKRLLVVLDCCHAGGMATAKALDLLDTPQGFLPRALPKALIAELKQGAGRAIFTSSSGEQRSWVRPDQRMSIFTQHFVEALQGAGNLPYDQYVRLSNMMNYLSTQVPRSAAQLCHAEQTPVFDTASEDFPIALVQGGKGEPLAPHPAPEAAPGFQATVTGERNLITQGKLSRNLIVVGDHVQVHGLASPSSSYAHA
jgi:uncharacterized caspase-like protein